MTKARSLRARALAALIGLAVAALAAVIACNALGTAPAPAPKVRVSDIPASYRDARLAPGHRTHVVYEGIACERCHGEHGFDRPDLATCATCHEQHTPLHPERPGAMAALAPLPVCVDCHSFTEKLSASEACMRCHQREQGLFAGPVGIHAPRLPDDDDERGAKDAKDATTTSNGQSDPHAPGRSQCADCHAPHRSPSLEPKPCESCHPTAGAVRHAGLVGGGCQSCHSVHERSHDAGDRCIACHAARGKHQVDATRALFAGHDVCTTCHRPHGFDRASVAQCRECHDRLPVLAEATRASSPLRRPKDGHVCASCHDKHAAAAPRACASCHASGERPLAQNHPAVARRVDLSRGLSGGLSRGRPGAAPAGAAACTGCHPVHDGALAAAAGAAALPCASCHTTTVSHAPSAACATCHPPHGAPAPRGAALCATCHEANARAAAPTGHADCTACHASAGHRPADPPPSCASCHAPVASAAVDGHRDCRGCHERGSHAPREVKACASCHAPVAESAPAAHRDCAACHTPHDGARRPTATCESCHRDRTAGHGAAPNQRGRAGLALVDGAKQLSCASCHRPHGPGGVPRPPECTTCHDKDRLPRLHTVYWHKQKCANCHLAHEPTGRADRATCLSCHKDRAAHEPNARSCATCHPFTQ